MVEGIEEKVKRSSISSNDVYEILKLVQALDENCKGDIIKFQISQLKGDIADATKEQLEQSHENHFFFFFIHDTTQIS